MTIVASGWARRCPMKAAMRRIGPSTLVVTVASAEARNDSGSCQSSTRMIPRHGDQDVEVRVPRQHLLGGGGDARGVRRVDLNRVDAGMLFGDLVEQLRAAAADDDGVPLRLQGQSQGETDSAGGAGMKIVLPEMFMV